MPGNGPHKFYWVAKPPVVFNVLAGFLFANTVLLLGLAFLGQYIFPPASANLPACSEFTTSKVALHAPAIICLFAKWDIAIQFILLGLIAITMLTIETALNTCIRAAESAEQYLGSLYFQCASC
jgi:hypothetical protein